MKTCTKCHKEFPATTEYFNKNSHIKGGIRSLCKECQSKQDRKYYANVGRFGERKNRLRRNFRITLDQYDEMFAAQNGVCAICGNINPDGNRLAVDHDHKTGKVRGLLCAGCNIGLGNLKEDVTTLSNAIVYLEKHKCD